MITREDVDVVVGAFGDHFTDAATVREVQRALAARGYKLAVDGILGPITRKMVALHNAAHGAAGDGDRITDGALARLGVSPLGAPAGFRTDPAVLAREARPSPILTPDWGSRVAPKLAVASAAVPPCGADGTMDGWWRAVLALCVVLSVCLLLTFLGRDWRKK